MLRSGHPIQEARAEVVSKDHVTHDMRHLVLKLVEPTDIAYWPGQYVDIAIPGTEETRSFSMANTSSKESGQLEFVIRCYPDGRFSHFLDTELAVGDQLDVVGPFGVFTLRDGRDSDIVFVGGGAGMAPILSVLRSLAEQGQPAQGDVLLRRPDAAGPLLREGALRADRDSCRTSGSCRRSPRPTRTSRGTARSA